MGDIRKARLHAGGKAVDGEVLLETAELVFRGARRIVIPFSSVKSVEASEGTPHHQRRR